MSDEIIRYEFGTVLEHPLIRGILWLVLAPTSDRKNYFAMRLDRVDRGGYRTDQGTVATISADTINANDLPWIVLEVIRA